jgi:uncharacterized membrane protein YdjX (TVP38/TMEM64 family)
MLILAPQIGIADKLKQLSVWVSSLGTWGPLAFIGLYVVAVVAALPGSVLTAAAGALFGSFWGVAYVSIAATCGACLAFLVGRYFARASVAGWLNKSEKFRRLDELTEQQGAIIVAITRLVPLFPFNLLNYGFGLTRVSFWTYAFWSWLCMLPGTVLYVVGTDVLVTALREGKIPWQLVEILGAALLVVTGLVVLAKKRLKKSPRSF